MIDNLVRLVAPLRLDRCRDQADLPVAVEILMETGLERFQSHSCVPDTTPTAFET